MSEPMTAAGRSAADLGHTWTECFVCGDDGRADWMLAQILAIEAQARAAALADAKAAVQEHLMQIVNRTRPMDQAEGLAILAAIDELAR